MWGLVGRFKKLPVHKQMLLVSLLAFLTLSSIFIYGILGGPVNFYLSLGWVILWFVFLVFSIWFFVGEESGKGD